MLINVHSYCNISHKRFKSSVFEVDHENEDLQAQFMQVYSELIDLKKVILESDIVYVEQLKSLCKDLTEWKCRVNASQMIYINLNKMTFEEQTCRVFAWCLKSDLPEISAFIQQKVMPTF